jgi:Cu(I)/Ag(I) efflux system membrane fusion protein
MIGKREIGWAAGLILVFVLGLILGPVMRSGSGEEVPVAPAEQEAAPTRWTCSMHPQIILPSNDQQCPICFMDLIPLEENSGQGLGPGDLALSPAALALADIRTTVVQRGPAFRTLRLNGMIEADESRTRTITAQVAGRLDRLLVDTTGQLVTRGQPLAEIYSPDLYRDQAALQAAHQSGAAETVAAVQERLRLWGLDQSQIDEMAQATELRSHVLVRSPAAGVVLRRQADPGNYIQEGTPLLTIADLSVLRVTLDAYEADLPWLKAGQTIQFTTRAVLGQTFTGEVAFLDPVLDARRRTAEVRLAVSNSEGLLKPGMLVTGMVEVALDAQGRPVADPNLTPSDWPLLIPATAPLLTGDRAVVYLEREEDGQSIFTGRVITLGPRAQDHYIVAQGLEVGDRVVSHGAFKVDSALQIQAKPSMMSRDEGTPEFVAALESALEHYYLLQKALADDDDSAAQQMAGALIPALDALDETSANLPSQGRIFWSGLRESLHTSAQTTAAAENIDARRVAFEPLSDGLWAAAQKFGQGGQLTVRRFHCPMAFDNAGAYWLQDHTTVANPYYGDAMLRCGSEVEVIQ